MKKLFLLLIVVLFTAPAQLFPQATDITIIHTNDIHSRMLGFSPNSDYTPFSLNDDETRGGMARIKTIIDTIRNNDENVIMVDAGDFTMGTVFQTLETQTGFQLRLMNQIGWDVAAIGNHEFDFGIDGLTDIITSATLYGEIPQLLLSNIQFCVSLADDDKLESLFDDGVISTYHIEEKGGLKVAFFALLGKDAYDVAPYAKPLSTKDQAETAILMNDILRNELGADVVIALSHSGVIKDKNGNYTLEDVDVAMACPGLDLIVSGHTHTTLQEPLMVNGVPIVQTGAYTYNLSRTVISFEDGKTTIKDYELIPVDDSWMGNREIQALVEEQMERINTIIFEDLGLRADSLIVETDFPITINEETLLKNCNLGPFVADAVYNYYQKLDENVDIALVVSGLLRDEILPGEKGMQYATDLYRVLPLGRGVVDENSPGYSLAKIYITGREIKNILEIMQIAPSISTANMPYWTGIRYSVNNLRVPLDKIYEVEIGSDEKGWERVNLSKNDQTLYSLGANAYILEFVGMIKDLSKGILSVVPKTKDGNPINGAEEVLVDINKDKEGIQEAKEWAALMDFCGGFEDVNGNGVPDIPQKYNLTNILISAENPDKPLTYSMIIQGDQKVINLRSPVKNTSLNPLTVFKASNGVTIIAMASILVILTLLFLLVRFFIKRVIRK